jgi:CRP-like cAMP-binding protein
MICTDISIRNIARHLSICLVLGLVSFARSGVGLGAHDAKEHAVNPSTLPKRYKNMLLGSLSAPEIQRLEPHLSPVAFKRNQPLHNPGQRVDTVYFLEDGVCSIVVTMKDGGTVEVGIIGRDSFVGLPAVLGTGHSPNRSFIQIPGTGFSVKAKTLREQSSDGSGGLSLGLQRGVQGLLAQTAQTAACNRVHELEERLARWLLMCHDRMQTDSLSITHEFLAMMLGTRRSTVTVAAGMLHKAGLIDYSRGNVKIENRKGLEETACECYSIVHEEYVRLRLL